MWFLIISLLLSTVICYLHIFLMLTVLFSAIGLISSFVSTLIVTEWILLNYLLPGSRDSIVAITTRPEAGWSGVHSGRGDFSRLHNVQNVYGSHTDFYSKGARGSSHWGIKRPGWKADHSPLLSAKIKNGGARCLLAHMPSWLPHGHLDLYQLHCINHNFCY